MAAQLVRAQAEGKRLTPFSRIHPDFDLAVAYEVAAAILRQRRERGEKPIGRKIGFTNRNIWPQYRVDTPIWAHVYDTTVKYAEKNVVRFPLAGLARRLREFKIVLGKNGRVQDRGTGANVLGSPLSALAYLVRVLQAQA